MDYLPFIPQLGAEGPLITRQPIDNIIKPGVKYTIIAIRSIGDVITSGEDVYKNIYIPLYLTREDYIRDLANDISLITLEDDSNKKYRIPSSYIIGYPLIGGVKYQDVGLAINLGALPVDFDLSVLFDSISNIIIEKLGVEPQITKANLSKMYYLSEDQDTIFRRRITYRKEHWVSDAFKLSILQEKFDEQTLFLRKLEEFIKLMGRDLSLCGPPCPTCKECEKCKECPNPGNPIEPIDPTNPPPVDCSLFDDPDICITVKDPDPDCSYTKKVPVFTINSDLLINRECVKRKDLNEMIYIDHDIKIIYKTIPDCDKKVKVLFKKFSNCCYCR